jgi:hypothetical protein
MGREKMIIQRCRRIGPTEVEVDLGEGLHPSVAVEEGAVHVTRLAAHVTRMHLSGDSKSAMDAMHTQDRGSGWQMKYPWR